ncbi:restriction endonuclease subunit S [Escherichia coli]|uniref:restriction endonuclease subunit S n=1 Tax=Escherichia coli TaxID=562 RepID=UPI00097E5D0D|nr:restriction endonuclease subunit S [Escherichia coli]MBY8589088.1 restriction endonuclease subunit S [Escherichia coli]MBY8729647.1 restriction endonuclease subunit S [Escherichia coli]MCV5156915.1 restriction endonuclease subunit S [Escherichia coli]MCV5173845.1 restriction endonuclease subunit S [Escherichia coli]MCV5316830.1 restriction endonuclease subunit S [Escherichia coli]
MSELSYLEKLLDGVEVEWLPLSGLARIRNGKDHKSLSEGEFPVYGSGGIMRYVDTYAYNKPSVLIPRKGSLGNLFFVNVPFWTVDTIFYTEIDEAQIRPKYLYYFLTTVGLGEMNQAGGVPSQTQSVLNKLKIPIPCPNNPEKSLAIQSEIVRILDKFTALTAELTAELNMRKKQYNYYRDQLLSFKEGEVNWTTLGNEELFHICAGGTPSKSKAEYWDNGSIPWLKSESCNNKPVYFSKDFISELGLKKSTAKLLPKNTTLIALVGATIFKTAFLEFEATTNQNIASIKSTKENIIADKFIFYFLTNLYNTLKSEMRNYGMLNLTNLRQFRIPIPCIAEQKRIVSILDKFDALTNSITEGLPREIELRQKQYEYYRDLLFSFPKPETVSN